jgi:hypothetical protein
VRRILLSTLFSPIILAALLIWMTGVSSRCAMASDFSVIWHVSHPEQSVFLYGSNSTPFSFLGTPFTFASMEIQHCLQT